LSKPFMNLREKVPYFIAGAAAGYFLKILIDDLEMANILYDIGPDSDIADEEPIKAKSE